MSDTRYSTIGAFGAGLIVLSSLILAIVFNDNGLGSDGTGTIFIGLLGFGGFISGIGIVIATASAYLRRTP